MTLPVLPEQPSIGMVVMGTRLPNWNPADASAWEAALGLVRVPLFGDAGHTAAPEEWDVLLDGRRSSFVLCLADRGGAPAADGLSWSWSSHVRHWVDLDKRRGEMTIHWWDQPSDTRRLQWPKDVGEAEWLLSEFDRIELPKAADVISHVLQAFRYIRASLPPDNPLMALRVLNALLTGLRFVRDGELTQQEWLQCQTMSDALKALGTEALRAVGLAELPPGSDKIPLNDQLSSLVRPQPRTGLSLDPYLLLRHAAGDLYQQAHLVIEQATSQLHFDGIVPTDRQHGVLRQRDVRFTPVVLARSLVQQALDAYGDRLASAASLDILDPACGSGIFLQEALRELSKRGFRGRLTLRGFDLSEISVAMAQFCLAQAHRDVSKHLSAITVDVRRTDALTEDWGAPDLILTNPPFADWRGMSAADRAAVREIMGPLAQGRPDKAMAFISNGLRFLPEGSVMASVLPAPVLDSTSGEPWREAVAETAQLHLLGRFQGYSFFRGAVLEPGFVVLRRPSLSAQARPACLRVLLADEHSEEKALRALRKPGPVTDQHYEVAEVAPGVILPNSWLPRSARSLSLIQRMSEAGVPTVDKLFDVRQGALTGRNRAFVLSQRELASLPASERHFFRPLADNAAIRDGRLSPGRFVFYPYDTTGLLLHSEDALRERVPTYYRRWLRPDRSALTARAGTSPDRWWVLTRPRADLQSSRLPKLVTKYFGRAGSFACDETGGFVVTQGYAWVWRSAGDDSAAAMRDFLASGLAWAYLALLNSAAFEELLACYCPTVRGGQFNLSDRFVQRVFIPDLARAADSLSRRLAHIGHQMHRGCHVDAERLSQLVNQAYAQAVPAPLESRG